MSGGFEKLDAFQIALDVAERVYLATREFPSDERFGLCTQLRRAATSVVSNIAEGYGRLGRGEYIKHLGYARGSACEIKAQLMICKRVGIAVPEAIAPMVERQIAVLNKLIEKLREDYVREPMEAYGSDLGDN